MASIETDADLLIALAINSLAEWEHDQLDLSPSDFSDEYPPAELLFIGRDEVDEQPEALIMEGRSEVKRRFGQLPKSIYKNLRSLMMDYEMGEEVPICALGHDGSLRFGTIPLHPDESPTLQ